jgi:hypothetical protein
MNDQDAFPAEPPADVIVCTHDKIGCGAVGAADAAEPAA